MPKFNVLIKDTAMIEVRARLRVEADSFREAVIRIGDGDFDEDLEWEEYDGWYERSGDPHYEQEK